MNWIKELMNRADNNKDELKKRKEKYDCEKDGHIYDIIDDFLLGEKNNRVGNYFLLECKKCKKRISISTEKVGFGELIDLWLNKEVNIEEYKRLKKEILLKIEEIKKHTEKPKRKRKAKKIKK